MSIKLRIYTSPSAFTKPACAIASLRQCSPHCGLCVSSSFGPSAVIAGAGVSPAGRPRLPVRLMVSLLYLKHAFNESDESLVERWSENVYWQFFSGMTFYEPKLPCDPAQISRFRRALVNVEDTTRRAHRCLA